LVARLSSRQWDASSRRRLRRLEDPFGQPRSKLRLGAGLGRQLHGASHPRELVRVDPRVRLRDDEELVELDAPPRAIADAASAAPGHRKAA
jgi:hypothetical protein